MPSFEQELQKGGGELQKGGAIAAKWRLQKGGGEGSKEGHLEQCSQMLH